jgi:hypothetical protein
MEGRGVENGEVKGHRHDPNALPFAHGRGRPVRVREMLAPTSRFTM